MGNKGVVGGGTLPEQIKVAQVVAPVDKTATFSSSAIDTQGYGFLIFLIALGAITGTLPTLNGKITECDTPDGSFTDCVLPEGNIGAVTAPEKTDADANLAHAIEFDCAGHKRYVKYSGVLAGTSPHFMAGVGVVKGGADYLPAD